jgi:GT2 family glycosyltransferase
MSDIKVDQYVIGAPVSVQVQSILYNNTVESAERALASMARSAELAIHAKVCSRVKVWLGDSSPIRCLSEHDIDVLQKKFEPALELNYRFFGENAGSARGHNLLTENVDTDFLLIQNPDVVVSPRLLVNLLEPFRKPDVGMVEAKQLPIEHPKDYDAITGATGWATTACAMIPVALFKSLEGFDSGSFFLYCDDVDFSWRVRLAGYKVIFNPTAVVFHDKRLSDTGGWQPSSSEHYFSAEAAMILAYKWSREDLADRIHDYFAENGEDYQKKAASEFDSRRSAGRLPKQLDPEHKIAYFSDNLYTKHRYFL